MGFFDKLFGKEKSEAARPVCEALTVYAPVDGTVIPLEEFPDELFSQEILGPGCGILPTAEVVCAPFNGTVTQVTDTRHAIGVTSDDGVEVLIHIGVDTVEMNGKGFSTAAKVGQKIVRGEPLIRYSLAEIRAAGHPDAVAVVVTNSDEFSSVALKAGGGAAAGDVVLKLEK